MQRLAAEVGIAPADVRAAAEDLDRHPAGAAIETKPGGKKTAAVTIIERTVPHRVDPAAYPALVQDIAVTLGHEGLVSTLGKDLRWRMVKKRELQRDLTVTISARTDGTHIKVEETNADLQGGWAVGVGIAAFVGGILIAAFGFKQLDVVGPTFAALATWVTGAAFAGRYGFRASRRSRHAELEGLVDRLVRGVTPDSAPPGQIRPGALDRPVQTPR